MIGDETAGLIVDTEQDPELNVHANQEVEDQEQWDGYVNLNTHMHHTITP
jgi:hypothetical protein